MAEETKTKRKTSDRTNRKGGLTGSKSLTENSAGEKAKAIAEAAGTVLNNVSGAAQTVSNAAGKITSTTSQIAKVGGDAVQAIRGLTGQPGYSHQLTNIQHSTDAYGGLAIPQTDYGSLIPSDLLHPQIGLKASEQELTAGLAEYAAGTRAQQLLQAGYKFIEEVGKTKQSENKAKQSIIKAAIEEVKVNQEVVNFDIANIDLAVLGEKRNQSNERLKQQQMTTVAMQNETQQLSRKFEALEDKREAEIQRIQAQTNDIIQKYLKDSIQGGV